MYYLQTKHINNNQQFVKINKIKRYFDKMALNVRKCYSIHRILIIITEALLQCNGIIKISRCATLIPNKYSVCF